MLDDLKMYARYVGGLRGFLRGTMTADEARQRIEGQLRRRRESFLKILDRGIYRNPRSAYRRLLEHAGATYGDVEAMVRADGIEAALERLYDDGVHVTLDEFKGRCPIRRGGLEFDPGPHGFDNPLLTRHYEARSSGSRSVGTRIVIDFELLVHESAYYRRFLDAHGVAGRPVAVWRAVPPVSSGMKAMLRYARVGQPAERWFGQSRVSWRPGSLRFAAFTAYTVLASRLWGRPLARPRYVPKEQADTVAAWLASKVAAGTPPLLDTNAAAGVRVCVAARRQGLDIAGTFFRFGGEPYTSGKAEVVAAAGCAASCHYSMAEIGNIGLGCAAPRELDDVHLLTDKVAVIQRAKAPGGEGRTVPVLVYTSVLPSCPRLMLNVDSDDYAVLEERDCGCPIGDLGLTRHLRRIRSYEKLTSEGVSFLGTELYRLVEEVLPAKFGGHATDYQLVEQERDGLPVVSVVVSPAVGPVDEDAVLSQVYATLHGYPGGVIMADQWRQGGTLRVLRREPYSTPGAKVLPLHIVR